MDVSQSGMRVRAGRECAAQVGDVVPLVIAGERHRVSVTVRVVRRSRVGLRGAELGLEFVRTPRPARAAVLQLARYGTVGVSPERIEMGLEDGEAAAPPPPPTPPRVEVEDLYAVIGLSMGATAEEIRSAYRSAARACHPDAAPGPEAAERFALVSKAYSVLRDPDLRARYDRMLRASAA